MKLIKIKKLKKVVKIFFVLLLVVSWTLTSLPRIPFINFPPKIEEARAAVANDAASESHTGTTGSASQASFTWTHTPVGTPRGALVFVYTISATKTVTSVTYGGTTMTEVTGGAAVDTATEPGRVDTFFLGASVPTGAQSVVVNRTNNTVVMYAVAATQTAAANTEVTGIILLQENQALAQQSVNDGSPGANSVRYAGAYSGLAAPPTVGADSTLLHNIDLGAFGASAVRETTAGQGARLVGFTAGADDAAAVHLAVREIPPTVALTGTVTASITEADIVTGGKTIILTVTEDTWVAAGATFDAERQNIINGIDSAQAESTGWDAEVKAKEVVGAVVRTSATVVTITLTAQAGYNITATETITATIPATALVRAIAVVATPTFAITAVTPTTFTQNAYRWYVDPSPESQDVTDAWGNPDIAQNTAITITPISNDPPNTTQELRLRVNFTVNGSNLAASAKQFKLQFKADAAACTDASGWTDVGGAAAWVYATSTVTDGTDLTVTRLSPASDVLEEYIKSTPTGLNPFSATVGQEIEYDFHIVGTNSATATQYRIRAVESSGTVFDAYTNCPTLQTEPGTGDLMRHGNVFSGGSEQGFFWAD